MVLHWIPGTSGVIFRSTSWNALVLDWDAWVIHQRWVQGGRIGEEPPPGVEPPEKWRRYIETGIDWVRAPNDAEFNRVGREFWSMQAELIPVIGTVGYALRPILINNRIHNVPETLPFAFETLLRANATPAQWFIRE